MQIEELLNFVKTMNERFKPVGFKWAIVLNKGKPQFVKIMDRGNKVVLSNPMGKEELFEWMFAYRHGFEEFQNLEFKKSLSPHLFPSDTWTGHMRVSILRKRKDPKIAWNCQLVLEYLKHRAEGQCAREWSVYGKVARQEEPKKESSLDF